MHRKYIAGRYLPPVQGGAEGGARGCRGMGGWGWGMLFIRAGDAIQFPSILKQSKQMSKNLLTEAAKKYTVFEISNVNKKSKNYGRKIYIASSYMTEENVLSRLRSMQDSKTGKGGSKEASRDIKAAGKNYDEQFRVRVVKSNLSRERAEEVKAAAIEKHTKVYNQEMRVQ
jgi:hypothetical protein